jgi:hypothetical protein
MPLFRRPDGVAATDVAPFRRIMPFIMRGRNESAVYFEQRLDLTRTLPFLDRWNAAHPERKITVFHVFLWAVVQALGERPRLNRFVSGSRLYQRDGLWVSFSAKKKLADDSPIVVVKRRFEPSTAFAAMVDALYADLATSRSDAKSHVDKELSLFLKLPGPILGVGVSILRMLDAWNLLPGSFIHPDPMYASVFIANLGSVKLDAPWHHLYEYGNIPLFAAIGQIHRDPVATADGRVEVRDVSLVRYTFDERIEDGLYCVKGLDRVRAIVEDPDSTIGGK